MHITASKITYFESTSSSREQIAMLTRQGFTVDTVDGITCIGICEDCGLPIAESDASREDSEGIMWHVACEKPGRD